MAEVGRKRAQDGDGTANVRKKLRPSELPLSQAKRSAIDSLVHMFRKKGTYDDIRRDLMKQYVSGPAKDELQSALKELVDRETDRNPSLLSKDPRMATTLIEGAGERSDIYANIMSTVNALLDRLMEEQGLPKMREYRIQEIGAEAAAEEEKRGSKTEEEWAQEAEARRQKREAQREKELEEERERERAERAKREERRRREKEEDEAREKARQEEKERRRKEREEREKEDEERRRKDRERIEKEREEERQRLKKEREEHEKSREARLKKIREEDAERERRIQEELDRDRGGRYRSGRGRSRTPDRDRDRRGRDRSRRRSRTRSRSRERERRTSIKPEDIKVDDDLALQLLLQESEQMKKSRQRPALERSESLEPPMRKAHPPKSLVPRDPVAVRLAKLDGKSASPAQRASSKGLRSPISETHTAAAKDEDTVMMDAPPADAKGRRGELSSKADKSRAPEVVHCLVEAAMIAGLDGTMIDILTGRHTTVEGAIATSVMIDARAATVVAGHARHVLTAASRGTRHAALHRAEKRDVETAPGLVPEADVTVIATATVIGRPLVDAVIPALGVQIILIDMYPAVRQQQQQPPLPPAPGSEKIAVSASVMIADLVGVTIAAIGHGATGLETMIVGMVGENGAVDGKSLTVTNLVAGVEIVMRRNETAIERPESGVESGVGKEAGIGVVIETGADV
ncbi:hypothetical protein COCVIDRAFT_92722 [Bipolaris victoriae FI3]|uniref:BOD1/SHG1 domain-containing protein n=1 Tax=Bipolaris victoriae (strain FI3) TaxID=930091 RepID=W7EFR4_BIPV3|nr:hypothetical protein COCVIDRAFT_92722 [Bipolaris victoriae FI3]